MTSQLNVDTIVDKAGSGGSNVKMANTSTYVSDGGAVTKNTVQGLVKGWVAVTGATDPAILDSHNVASITDSADGIVQTNFTSAFSSANHCTTTGLEIEDGSNSNYMYAQILIDKSAETTSRVEINTGFRASNSSGFDKNFSYYHQTTGDLA
jgi:hypothetical protein